MQQREWLQQLKLRRPASRLSGKMLLIGVGLSALAASAASAGQVVSEERARRVVAVDGMDLYLAQRVVRRFFRTERNPECYRVLFARSGDELTVSFIPKSSDPVYVYEGEPPPVVAPPCGRNVGYVIDRRGNVLRRVYSR